MSRLILAIDPGTFESAWVAMGNGEKILSFGKWKNENLVGYLRDHCLEFDLVLIEGIASYGMPVGEEVFKTCLWSGVYIEACRPTEVRVIYRREVKKALCENSRANDAAIRQRIIDLYGPGKEKAIGTKKKPGPLYGVKSDIWQAVAIALSYQVFKFEGATALT